MARLDDLASILILTDERVEGELPQHLIDKLDTYDLAFAIKMGSRPLIQHHVNSDPEAALVYMIVNKQTQYMDCFKSVEYDASKVMRDFIIDAAASGGVCVIQHLCIRIIPIEAVIRAAVNGHIDVIDYLNTNYKLYNVGGKIREYESIYGVLVKHASMKTVNKFIAKFARQKHLGELFQKIFEIKRVREYTKIHATLKTIAKYIIDYDKFGSYIRFIEQYVGSPKLIPLLNMFIASDNDYICVNSITRRHMRIVHGIDNVDDLVAIMSIKRHDILRLIYHITTKVNIMEYVQGKCVLSKQEILLKLRQGVFERRTDVVAMVFKNGKIPFKDLVGGVRMCECRRKLLICRRCVFNKK